MTVTTQPSKRRRAPRDLSSVAGVPVLDHGWRPGQPATYVFFECDMPYYVGMGSDLPRRLQEHRRAGLGRVEPGFVEVKVYPVWSIKAAQRLERNLIIFYEPKANDNIPRISENERAWFEAFHFALRGEGDRAWAYCPDCGELMMRFFETFVPVTRGANCADCLASPHWDPSERCWTYIAGVAAGLIGQPSNSIVPRAVLDNTSNVEIDL